MYSARVSVVELNRQPVDARTRARTRVDLSHESESTYSIFNRNRAYACVQFYSRDADEYVS